MRPKSFNDKIVRSIRPPQTGCLECGDQSHPGLRLRTYANGRRVWLYRPPRKRGEFSVKRPGETFAVFTGTAGPAEELPEMGSTEAIARYEVLRGQVRQDRTLEREIAETEARLHELNVRAGHGMRVRELVAAYMDHKSQHTKRPERIEYLLRRLVVKPLGDLPAAAVRRRHVADIVDHQVALGNPQQGRKIFYMMKALFGWALSRDHIRHNPTDGCEVPKKNPPSMLVNRPLADDEIAALWRYLQADLDENPLFKNKPRFLWKGTVRCLFDILLTGERRVQSASSEWSWRVENGWWNVPAEVMKKTKSEERDHGVYRSAFAEKNIAAMRGVHPTLVFPSSLGKVDLRTITNAMTSASRRLNELGLFKGPATVHGLRSTMTTWLTEQQVDERVIKVMLHHAVAEGALVTYAHPKFERQCREAWTAWQEHVRKLSQGSA